MTPVDRTSTFYRERRRYVREACAFQGTLFHAQEAYACTVVDISPGGARLRLEQSLTRQMAVKLKMTQEGEFTGTIAWASAKSIGVHFAHRPLV